MTIIRDEDVIEFLRLGKTSLAGRYEGLDFSLLKTPAPNKNGYGIFYEYMGVKNGCKFFSFDKPQDFFSCVKECKQLALDRANLEIKWTEEGSGIFGWTENYKYWRFCIYPSNLDLDRYYLIREKFGCHDDSALFPSITQCKMWARNIYRKYLVEEGHLDAQK